jgi:hypothetical protein
MPDFCGFTANDQAGFLPARYAQVFGQAREAPLVAATR